MDDTTRFENRFEERIRAFARTGVQAVDAAAVARAAAVGHPKSPATRPAQRRLVDEIHRPRSMSRTTFAAAAVLAMLAVGGALFVVAGDPSPTPSVSPSPSLPVVVAPSASPSPSESAQPSSTAVPNQAGAWIATGSMGTPRSGHTAVRLLDGRVLVAGGYPGDEPDLAVTSAELYDPESGTWSPTGNMLKPHGGFPATLLRDGRVLVGDVADPGADNPVLGAELYDPATGTWSATGPMVKPDRGSAVLLLDGRVLVVHSFGKSELFDPDSGTWTATGQMLAYFHQAFASVLMPDGRVLVAGGGDGMRYAGDEAELYDPESRTWSAIANMNGRKEVIAATLLRDGTVLVMGNGFLGEMPPELYDPATGAWTVVGEAGDCCGSATLLLNGKVLVAGGVACSEATDSCFRDSSAKLYDPVTGTWTITASMLREDQGGPATLLLDGTVLVAGGDSGSAELYVPAGVSPPPLPAFPSPTPVPTPTPSPTPVPTPVPAQAGPVPPDARSWTVAVWNRSSEPATLFVAEENEDGLMGSLVGSATPNVVPPATAVQVTFLLPAKGTDWAIFVNPETTERLPTAGPAEMSLPGQILINTNGQTGWLSP